MKLLHCIVVSVKKKGGDILKTIGLKKATYHDERKRIKNYVDKYEDVKVEILKLPKAEDIADV